MTHDWNTIIADNVRYIVDCAKQSGVGDVAVVLADAEEIRERVPNNFAQVIQSVAGRKPMPLQTKRGEKIMVIPIDRLILQGILSEGVEIRSLTSAVGTLVLWVACLEPDEFKVIDVHRASVEHN
jgi:hypothetical protein